MKRAALTLTIVVAVIAAAIGLFKLVENGSIREPTTKNNVPVVFSNDRMLLELWSTYKSDILEEGTLRALDKSQNNLTTSEGQSYTMIRALWMDDKETFDKVWQWTKYNMQREDKLISWRFGEKSNGEYGIQTEQGGQNTATDADVDIAYALVMASTRWKEAGYLYDSQSMIKSIWQKEVVRVNGDPVLVSNDIERMNKDSVLVNPSYFAPYAYRIFAKIDPENDWKALIDSSYSISFASADSNLDTKTSSGLVPNWVRIDRETGVLFADETQSTDYGYDAFRTPWRLALDLRYNQEPRAKQVLSKFSTLKDSWADNQKLASVYSHNGAIKENDSVPASYGANIGYFITESPTQAKEIYEKQLLVNYNPDSQSWKTELSYYDDNWAWFGMALYLNQLPDLASAYGK